MHGRGQLNIAGDDQSIRTDENTLHYILLYLHVYALCSRDHECQCFHDGIDADIGAGGVTVPVP